MEEWKDIDGYNGFYQVSNIGRIKSFKNGRHGIGKEYILKLSTSSRVYSQVSLNEKIFSVHRLVATHFIPNPLNLPWVLHRDETLDNSGKLNNSKDNLYWGTPKDNSLDMHKKGRGYSFFRGKSSMWKGIKGGEHFASKKIVQLSKTGELIKEFSSITEAGDFLGLSHGNISYCCNGKRKTAGGFIWRFI